MQQTWPLLASGLDHRVHLLHDCIDRWFLPVVICSRLNVVNHIRRHNQFYTETERKIQTSFNNLFLVFELVIWAWAFFFFFFFFKQLALINLSINLLNFLAQILCHFSMHIFQPVGRLWLIVPCLCLLNFVYHVIYSLLITLNSRCRKTAYFATTFSVIFALLLACTHR